MSFDSLPNEVLLRIFEHLTLRDRVRLSGVNREFKEISHQSIIDQKDLSFTDDLTTYFATSLPISSYLQDAAQNLERINLVVDSDFRRNLTKVILGFAYPKLIEFSINYVKKMDHWDRGPGVVRVYPDLYLRHFERMLVESRRLKIIELENCRFHIPDESVFVAESLEILDVGEISSDQLNSLVNRVPNLKSFTAEIAFVENAPLAAFMRSTPKLESLKFVSHSRITDFVDITTDPVEFPALKSISIKQSIAIELLDIIPSRFPNVETLILKTSYVTARGICNAALRLISLKKLHIFGCAAAQSTYDSSNEFKELSACANLHELILADFVINEETFVKLVQYCPDLRKFGVFTIAACKKAEKAARILRAVIRGYQFDSSIKLQFKSSMAIKVWKSPYLENAMNDAKECGLTVEIEELKDDF